MSIALKYAQQQLGSTGFVLLNATIAATLRPDLFPDGVGAAGSIAEANQRNTFSGLLNVTSLEATIEGFATPVPLLTRSMARLKARIAELTGYEVTELHQGTSACRSQVAAAAQQAKTEDRRRAAQADELAKLRALAQQDLPLHQCTQRTEILAARSKLAAMGEVVSGVVPT